MLPDDVKKQAVAIKNTLSCHGWSVAAIEQPFEDEREAAEFWRIESEWSPQGVHAYLTFLVDLSAEADCVWAVCASRDRPHQPFGTGPIMRLRNVWQKELPSFINELSQFRFEPVEEVE